MLHSLLCPIRCPRVSTLPCYLPTCRRLLAAAAGWAAPWPRAWRSSARRTAAAGVLFAPQLGICWHRALPSPRSLAVALFAAPLSHTQCLLHTPPLPCRSYTVYASARNAASLKGLEVEGIKTLGLDVTKQARCGFHLCFFS